jgi:hypothetical protein
VTINTVNIATVVPEDFAPNRNIFICYRVFWLALQQCVCVSLRPTRLCLNVLQRPSDISTSFTVETKHQVFARTLVACLIRAE